jgi:general secretion pathway protein M
MLEQILNKINFAKLNKRERYIVFGIAALVALFIIVQVVVRPLFARNDRLERELQAKTTALAEMRKMRAEYESLKTATRVSSARFDRREKGWTLYKFMNRLADETGIKGNIKSMKPTSTEQKGSPYKISRVDMRLESVTLAQLTDYLHRVETSTGVISIRKMVITKKEDKENLLSAVLQVETLET